MEGEVLFNGEKLTKRIKKRVGYVLQGGLIPRDLIPVSKDSSPVATGRWQHL